MIVSLNSMDEKHVTQIDTATVRNLSSVDLIRAPASIVAIWLAAWLYVFHEPLLAALRVWYENETYHHAFFVLPLLIFSLVRDWGTYRSRMALSQPLLGLLYLPVFVLWAMGSIAALTIVQQLAAIAFIWVSALVVLGPRFCLQAWFPMLVIGFAIPVGEEIVPHMQTVTAILAKVILYASNLTFHAEGLDIHTANGVYHVAEACAGLKFLIGCLFLGLFLSYLQFATWRKRAFFMCVCAIIPIVANGIRVALTVGVGEIYGVQYVEGFDHIVYGWVFFALVVVMLVALSERWRDLQPRNGAPDEARLARCDLTNGRRTVWFAVCAMLVAYHFAPRDLLRSELSADPAEGARVTGSTPSYPGHSGITQSQISDTTELYVVTFRGDEQGGKLVSQGNDPSGSGWSLARSWDVVTPSSTSVKTHVAVSDNPTHERRFDPRVVPSWLSFVV